MTDVQAKLFFLFEYITIKILPYAWSTLLAVLVILLVSWRIILELNRRKGISSSSSGKSTNFDFHVIGNRHLSSGSSWRAPLLLIISSISYIFMVVITVFLCVTLWHDYKKNYEHFENHKKSADHLLRFVCNNEAGLGSSDILKTNVLDACEEARHISNEAAWEYALSQVVEKYKSPRYGIVFAFFIFLIILLRLFASNSLLVVSRNSEGYGRSDSLMRKKQV